MLANSDVGVLVLNKDRPAAAYNRLVGRRRELPLLRQPECQRTSWRRRSRRTLGAVPSGSEMLSRAGFQYRGDRLETRASYSSDRHHGSTTSLASSRGSASAGPTASISPHLRPRRRVRGWLREVFPHYQLINQHARRRRRVRFALHGLPRAVHVPGRPFDRRPA